MSFRARPPRLSLRRPQRITCAQFSKPNVSPNDSNLNEPSENPSDKSSSLPNSGSSLSQSEDSQWLQLAQEIAPSSQSDTVPTPPPKWTYPDGDPKDVGPDNPWKLWESAVEKEKTQSLTPRDLKAETDFWRGAARDLTSDTNPESSPEQNFSGVQNDTLCNSGLDSAIPTGANPQLKSDPFTVRSDSKVGASSPKQSPFTTSSIPSPDSGDSNSDSIDLTKGKKDPSSSTEIWQEARGVTAKMTSMEKEIRHELDKYNPLEGTDEYRQMARDLLGPTNDEPWEDKDPVPVSDRADTGSGWNPDVDWMRFDDVGREKALKDAAAQRRESINDSDSTAQGVFNGRNPDSTNNSDESNAGFGQETFAGSQFGNDEGDETKWNTYTDPQLSGSPFSDGLSEGKIPGFMQNKMRSSSMYGSGRLDAQRDIEDMQRRGIELRNPKDDTDAWRGTARELAVNSDLSNNQENIPSTIENAESENISTSSSSQNTSFSEELSSEEESSSWSKWQASKENWEKRNESLEERDPKKEVDVWRSSVKELLSGVSIPVEDTAGGADNEPTLEEDSRAWENWKSSDEKWKQQVIQNEEEWMNARRDGENSNTYVGLEDENNDAEQLAWKGWNKTVNTDMFNNGDAGSPWSKQFEPLVSGDFTKDSEERVRGDKSVSPWLSMAKEVGSGENDSDTSNPSDAN